MAFTVCLACHIGAALTCVMTGPVAMLSTKRRGRHTRFGAIYDWSFSLAFVSLTGLSVLRWATDGDLLWQSVSRRRNLCGTGAHAMW